MAKSKKASQVDTQEAQDSPPARNNSLVVGALIMLAIIIAAVPGFYFYLKYQEAKKLSSTHLGPKEVDTIITRVAKLIELPKGENPTLATVSDINKLKGQTFFRNAENGDKVLIFKIAKKAILYRPSTDKIIEVGPINLGPPITSQETASPSASIKQIQATVLNGTTTKGLGSTTEKKLKEKYPPLQITSVGNAKKTDYSKTLIIDLTGQNQTISKDIAQFLGGEVRSTLPEGELKPEADILIIIGQ